MYVSVYLEDYREVYLWLTGIDFVLHWDAEIKESTAISDSVSKSRNWRIKAFWVYPIDCVEYWVKDIEIVIEKHLDLSSLVWNRYNREDDGAPSSSVFAGRFDKRHHS